MGSPECQRERPQLCRCYSYHGDARDPTICWRLPVGAAVEGRHSLENLQETPKIAGMTPIQGLLVHAQADWGGLQELWKRWKLYCRVSYMPRSSLLRNGWLTTQVKTPRKTSEERSKPAAAFFGIWGPQTPGFVSIRSLDKPVSGTGNELPPTSRRGEPLVSQDRGKQIERGIIRCLAQPPTAMSDPPQCSHFVC